MLCDECENQTCIETGEPCEAAEAAIRGDGAAVHTESTLARRAWKEENADWLTWLEQQRCWPDFVAELASVEASGVPIRQALKALRRDPRFADKREEPTVFTSATIDEIENSHIIEKW
jgi:hypothetical protein